MKKDLGKNAEGKSKVMGKVFKVAGCIFLLFAVSVVLVNLVQPAIQKKVGPEYKNYISELKNQEKAVCTERVMCIEDNEEALLWRLRMIGAAEKRIVLSTFDLRTDRSSLDVMAALYDAAERGVEVKLLIDGIYQPVYLRDNTSFYALCAHENVEARIYNPVNLYNIYNLNYRMHDKYIMVDDSMYLLGGRNTSNTFLGKMHGGSNIDRELLVYHAGDGKGESFRQLEEYFEQIWEEECVQRAESAQKQENIEEEYKMFRQRYQQLLEKQEAISCYDEWYDSAFAVEGITLLANETHAGNKEPRVLYALEQLSAGAESILIQSPYAICNDEMYSVLRNMSKDAEVKLYLNAVERGSNPWGCTDYLNHKKKLLETGTDVYEVMNEYAVHTKTVLIGDNISVIGSYNLDMRSTYLDTELMLVVESERLNGDIRETIENYEEKSIEVLADGTETAGDLYQERELTAAKKVFYGILRVIIRPFRHLL